MLPFHKKTRFWSRFLIALALKYYLAIFVGALAGTVSFFTAPKLLGLLPKIRPTQTTAVVGRYNQSDIPLFIQQKISLGLTTLTTDLRPAPALTKSWNTSDDGLVYTFDLASQYRWHDGSLFSSSDIDYSFRDATTEAPNSDQLVIKLKQPFSPLPAALSRPVFKLSGGKLLGLGPYRVARLAKNGQIIQSILLDPVDSHSDLPRLEYVFYPTQSLAILAFKLGLVDAIAQLASPPPFSGWPTVHSQSTVQLDRYVGLFFDISQPMFSGPQGKNLRLALAYAIDKSRWTDRAVGPISPASWAFNPDLKPYSQDLPKAQQLVEKLDQPPGPITISTTPGNLDVAGLIKSDWEKVGLKVEVAAVSDYSSTFSVLLITQVIPTDPDQYNLWHSTQSTNFTHLDNKRIDKLLEDGRREANPLRRLEIYHEFQKHLVEELPVVFLFHPLAYSVFR